MEIFVSYVMIPLEEEKKAAIDVMYIVRVVKIISIALGVIMIIDQLTDMIIVETIHNIAFFLQDKLIVHVVVQVVYQTVVSQFALAAKVDMSKMD